MTPAQVDALSTAIEDALAHANAVKMTTPMVTPMPAHVALSSFSRRPLSSYEHVDAAALAALIGPTQSAAATLAQQNALVSQEEASARSELAALTTQASAAPTGIVRGVTFRGVKRVVAGSDFSVSGVEDDEATARGHLADLVSEARRSRQDAARPARRGPRHLA